MLVATQGLIDRCAWNSVVGGGRLYTEQRREGFELIKQCVSIKGSKCFVLKKTTKKPFDVLY